MAGIELHQLLSPARLAENQAFILPALRGESQHFQHLSQGSDGSLRRAATTYIPDVVDGEVRGVLVLVSDITETKPAELRLKETNAEPELARDKADAANCAKNAFLANMSHEIRTPMNAIIGLTHLLRRDANDPVESERLEKVSDAAGHSLQVANDILDLSKIEAGMLNLEQVDFSLRTVMSRACSLLIEPPKPRGWRCRSNPGTRQMPCSATRPASPRPCSIC